jgi:hypothetical protein
MIGIVCCDYTTGESERLFDIGLIATIANLQKMNIVKV